MDSYYYIVNLTGKSVADLRVLSAIDDASALSILAKEAANWVGFETIFLYFGERFVGSLVDGGKGFPTTALGGLGLA